MIKQENTQVGNQSKSRNPKKKWIIVGVVLGVLLLPLVVLDIKYKVEFAEYDAEVRRIASYLPEGSVEGTIGQEEYPRYQRGNGLYGRAIECHVLGIGMSCPIVNQGYLVKIEPGQEMDLGRKILMEAGYEIYKNDLIGGYSGTCQIAEKKICTVHGIRDKYSSAITMIADKKDPRTTGLTIGVAPRGPYDGPDQYVNSP